MSMFEHRLDCLIEFERGDEIGQVPVGDPAQLSDLDAAELAGSEQVIDLVAADLEYFCHLLDGVCLHAHLLWSWLAGSWCDSSRFGHGAWLSMSSSMDRLCAFTCRRASRRRHRQLLGVAVGDAPAATADLGDMT